MRRHPPPNGGELLLRRGSVRECLPRVSRRSTAVHRPTVIPAFHALTVPRRSTSDFRRFRVSQLRRSTDAATIAISLSISSL